MKKLIIALVLLLCNCGHKTPLDKEFTRIYDKEYKLNVYDCSNKAAEFLTWLHVNGHTDSRIWYWYGEKGKSGHCVVECEGLIYDPTSGRVKMNLEDVKKIGQALEFADLGLAQDLFPKEWSF